MELFNEIISYYKDNKKYKHNDQFTEIIYRKGSERFKKLIQFYRDIELEKATFGTLPKEQIEEIIMETFIEMFGEEYKKIVADYVSLTKKVKGSLIENVISYNILNDEAILKCFLVTNCESTYQISICGHEYTHALLLPYYTDKFNQTIGNVHYMELASMFAERVMALGASSKIGDKDFVKKVETIRAVDSMNHAKGKERAMLDMIPMERDMRFLLDYYFDHKGATYIMSDMYSSHLFDLYRDDPKRVMEKYKAFLKGDLYLPYLLDYFGIYLTGNETYFGYQKKINCNYHL